MQGTINGLGESTGNADLCQVIPNLELKLRRRCLPADNLKLLTEVSRFVYEVANIPLADAQPFVGRAAFAHKGGLHVDAVRKNPVTYEHVAAGGGRQRAPAAAERALRLGDGAGEDGDAQADARSEGHAPGAQATPGARERRLSVRGRGGVVRAAGAADAGEGKTILRFRGVPRHRREARRFRRADHGGDDQGARRRGPRNSAPARATAP